MSPRLSKPETPAIQTRDDLELCMEAAAVATHKRAEVAARMEQALAAIRAQYAAELDQLDVLIDAHVSDLQAWARAHRAEFGDRQSIDLTHGTLGYRIGMPELVTVKGKTFDDVLANLSLLGMTAYIRQRQEPDKAKLLSDREQIGAEKLEAIGVRIRQAERFYVEPRTEQKGKAAA